MNVATNYSMILNQTGDGAPVKVEFVSLKKAALTFRALNHKLRQQIIKLIDEHNKLTVTGIYERLHLEQSVASQHLAILRRAGIVKTYRDGKFVFYSVNTSRVAQIVQCVNDLNA